MSKGRDKPTSPDDSSQILLEQVKQALPHVGIKRAPNPYQDMRKQQIDAWNGMAEKMIMVARAIKQRERQHELAKATSRNIQIAMLVAAILAVSAQAYLLAKMWTTVQDLEFQVRIMQMI